MTLWWKNQIFLTLLPIAHDILGDTYDYCAIRSEGLRIFETRQELSERAGEVLTWQLERRALMDLQTKRWLSTHFLNIVWMSPEVHLPHFGSRIIIKPTSKQKYHCGASDNSRRNGIAIFMSEKARFVLIEWKTVNDRMVNAHFKEKFCNISVQCIWSNSKRRWPICDKDKFYAKLQL